ncbi:MAG TPA: hypothetical protein VIT91_10605 [Chthoniobacterales bacterium]
MAVTGESRIQGDRCDVPPGLLQQPALRLAQALPDDVLLRRGAEGQRTACRARLRAGQIREGRTSILFSHAHVSGIPHRCPASVMPTA